MRRMEGLENLGERLPWPVVTVGTFDGVHLGHQRVLAEVVEWARACSGTAVVVTFKQPPRSVLSGDYPPLVTSVPHRMLLLERLGVDVCLVLEFTRELARTRVTDFVRRVLVEGLAARGVVMGHGSAFGRDREGDEAFLRQHAQDFGFEVRSVAPVLVEDEAVSSTRIRSAVLAGDFDLAARLLGRPFSVYGTVVRGAGRGRDLGFPTANLDLRHELAPTQGVYLARAVVAEESRPALVSVGTQPTFGRQVGREPDAVVEVLLLDFDRELYERDIEVEFLKRIRSQKRFPSTEELVRQIRQDVARAREYFRLPGEQAPQKPGKST